MDWIRSFGATGLNVSAVGFGAGHIGDPTWPEEEAGRLLDRALDLGITLLDAARAYGVAEERIGRHLAARRSEFVLSTKIGYGIPGFADWTPEIIPAGVTEALRRLRTDYLDIVHLHSCPRETLQRGGVIEALNEEVRRGRVRVAAYSGDNEALRWAAERGGFGSLQCSVNVVDPWALRHVVPGAAARGQGVIAKRPLANAPWRFAQRPVGDYAEVYWDRWQRLGVDPGGLAWNEVAVRFAAHAPGVSSCIVGTRSIDHLERNVALARRGPLPDPVQAALREAHEAVGRDWPGEV